MNSTNISMRKLTEKIISDFSPQFPIEVYVLDEMGDPFEVYVGLPFGLSEAFLESVTSSFHDFLKLYEII